MAEIELNKKEGQLMKTVSKGSRLWFAAVLAASGAALALAAVPASASSPTLRVGTCSGATYSTIQAAVDASGPGATIKVCPGTYNEQVRIAGTAHNGLKLVAIQHRGSIIKWPTVETAPLALVDVNASKNVTVQGFVISGPFSYPGCSVDRHEGVLVENGANVTIHDNQITGIRNSLPAMYGCQEGDAVAVGRRTGGATPGKAEVDYNLIDNYQKNGVQVVNAGSRADVEHNTVIGSSAGQSNIASNGIVVFNGAAATIEYNWVSNNKYTPTPMSTGISTSQTPTGSVVLAHNMVFDNDYGIEVDTTVGGALLFNHVRNSVSDGIQLCGDAASGCGPLTGFKVQHNDSYNNKGDGINVLGATGNTLTANKTGGNTAFDCQDTSTGTRTAGTANTWTTNVGVTSSPAGLCHKK
jgi:nitrous oxidase accessory protein NosD